MTHTREKVVGIMRGMGPEATVDLMQRIIRLTPAMDDADHIRCIVANNPKVPSRIKAIIENDYRNVGQNLKQNGAEIAIIACTELSALGGDVSLSALDAAEILASEIVQVATNRKKTGDRAGRGV